jgi:hypothetical protein
MKKIFSIGLLAVGLLVSSAKMTNALNPVLAQSDNGAFTTVDQGSSKPIVLSGCLRRGSGSGEYTLIGPALHWWELKSVSVNLALYIDEEVKVSAVKSPSDDGTLTVTELTLVSTSCGSWW